MKIFISYLRGDAVALAGRLYDRLSSCSGAESVLMDHANIPAGSEFTDYLAEPIYRITQSDVLLVLIGPKWMELLRSNVDLNVLGEITTALEHDIRVIPVLLGDTPMPQESALPPSIQGLAMKQALRLEPGERFNSDFKRLLQALPGTVMLKTSLIERFKKWFRR